ncbi:hypothetical protein BDQ17DRAFT_1267493 [Cyathus striatus]|nr:hypothetical protein BDQ17DRAFT_1267493 [Cyathus striatus]
MPAVPSEDYIRTKTTCLFNVRPYLWQIKVVQAIFKRDGDIISIAGTGMGKTLMFWMPLLFRPASSMQIIVMSLNILSKQNVELLRKAGMRGIFIGRDTAT